MRLIDADNIKYVFDLTIEKPIYSGKDIELGIGSMKTVEPQKVGRSDMYKILQSIRAECWDAGWNMDGEFKGAWTKYRDIEKIIDKYMQKLEEGD